MPPCLNDGDKRPSSGDGPDRSNGIVAAANSSSASPILTSKDVATAQRKGGVCTSHYKHEPLFEGIKLSWMCNLVTVPLFLVALALLPWPRIRLAVLGLVAFDAFTYYTRRGSMAGMPYTPPLVSIVAVILRPVWFWDEQANLAIHAGNGMSCNTLLGFFMVYVTDTKLCREVLTGEASYGLYVHPNAWWLLGDMNLVYMETEPHKRFRKLLNPALFSAEALRQYAQAHERVARAFLAKMAKKCSDSGGQPLDVRIEFRAMAVAASQESFLGPYLTDDVRSFLEKEILVFMMGFLCFPFPYLNTGLAKAVKARKNILEYLEPFVARARENAHKEDYQPTCLLDHWEKAIVLEAKESGVDPHSIEGCSDYEVASSVLDFLFAAQDATNSALSFTLDVLDAHPDVVCKIRDEVNADLAAAKSSSDGSSSIWSRMSDGEALPYTKRAVNQLLHHKPPVPMIPHRARKDVVLGGHFLPKGTIIIPSLVEAARTSGMSRTFDPDADDQDSQFVKTITFGGGQHKCAGRRYAERLLRVFVSILATEYEIERVGKRPQTLDIIYFPTLFPAQNNFVVSKKEGH